MTRRVVGVCPVCTRPTEITRFHCPSCEAVVDARVPVPPFLRLPDELQLFVLIFLRCRGNIREVEKTLGISYPTVCKKLDHVNALLSAKAKAEPTLDREAILKKVESGELTAKRAAAMLKGER